MDKEQFVKLMIGLAENFQAQISTGLIDLFYKSAMNDGFTIDQFQSAAEKLLREHKYTSFPVYADFYQAIMGSPTERASQQADLIINSIRHGNKTEFNDPVTHYVMNTRWKMERLRETLREDGEKWFRKDFIETYIAYANTKNIIMLEDNTPKQITGMCDKIGNL